MVIILFEEWLPTCKSTIMKNLYTFIDVHYASNDRNNYIITLMTKICFNAIE